VPAAVGFTIDFRAPMTSIVEEMDRQVEARFHEIAARRGLSLAIERYARSDATPMDAGLQALLARGVARAGANLSARMLPSGAGHDAMIMAALCPSAMLFVRNEKGVSHSPLENMTPEDAGIAVKVLIETVLELARAAAS
jgi:allantoate deiminase